MVETICFWIYFVSDIMFQFRSFCRKIIQTLSLKFSLGHYNSQSSYTTSPNSVPQSQGLLSTSFSVSLCHGKPSFQVLLFLSFCYSSPYFFIFHILEWSLTLLDQRMKAILFPLRETWKYKVEKILLKVFRVVRASILFGRENIWICCTKKTLSQNMHMLKYWLIHNSQSYS